MEGWIRVEVDQGQRERERVRERHEKHRESHRVRMRACTGLCLCVRACVHVCLCAYARVCMRERKKQEVDGEHACTHRQTLEELATSDSITSLTHLKTS